MLSNASPCTARQYQTRAFVCNIKWDAFSGFSSCGFQCAILLCLQVIVSYMQWLEKCHKTLGTLTTNLREKEIYNQLSEKVRRYIGGRGIVSSVYTVSLKCCTSAACGIVASMQLFVTFIYTILVRVIMVFWCVCVCACAHVYVYV